MCYSCDYCETALPGGKLRMVPDPLFGGATQMTCHDCFHAACDDDDCAWLAFQTADEWAGRAHPINQKDKRNGLHILRQ